MIETMPEVYTSAIGFLGFLGISAAMWGLNQVSNWWNRRSARIENQRRFNQITTNLKRQQQQRNIVLRRDRKARERMYDELKKDRRKQDRRLEREARSARDAAEERRREARSRFDSAVSKALPAFREGKAAFKKDAERTREIINNLLQSWETQFGQRMSGFGDIKSQQKQLMSELRNAPSSVAEQARQMASRQLQLAVNVAAQTGGTAGVQGQELMNQANNQYASMLGSTLPLRMQEQQAFLQQRQNLLGQQAQTELGMADLATKNVGIQGGLADTQRSLAYDQVRLGQAEAGLLADIARMGADIDIGMGSQMGGAESRMLQYLNARSK